MSDFRIKLDALHQATDEMAKLYSDLGHLDGEIQGVRSRLTGDLLSRAGIGRRLSAASETVRAAQRGAGSVRSALQTIRADYQKTEKTVGDVKLNNVTVQSESGIQAEAVHPDAGMIPGANLSSLLRDFISRLLPFPRMHTGLLVMPELQILNDPRRRLLIRNLQPLIGDPRIFRPAVYSLTPALIGTLFAQEGDGSVTPGKTDAKSKFKSSFEQDLVDQYKDKSKKLKAIDDFEDAHRKKTESMYYWDPKNGKVKVDPNDEKAKAAFKEHNKRELPVDMRFAGVGTSASISALALEGETSGSIGGASGSLDLAKAEAKAEAYIGKGYMGASAGASFTAFSAEEKAYLGTENTQVFEKVSVEAGKVGAKAEGSVGLWDKDGKFKPNAYVGAKAEAIAGEISGAVGVKALGAEASLKGSLNYGVGAHANVGIHDGKLSLDLGATLGVGASVSVEIDVSGTVTAVAEGAKNAVSAVGSFFGWW